MHSNRSSPRPFYNLIPISRRHAWCLLVALVAITLPPGIVAPAFAQAATPSIDHADRPCVLLRNGNVLFGEATRVGDTVSIKRADNSLIHVPAKQVSRIGLSLQQLYEHRRKTRFQGDLGALQTDIRWCIRHGLLRQAGEDVLQARQLDPGDPETIQLLRQIASELKASVDDRTAPNSEQPAVIRTVSHQMPIQPASAKSDLTNDDQANLKNDSAPRPLLDQRSTSHFIARIQPILMNRCVSCHARQDASNQPFQLHTALTSKWAPTIVARENLVAVMQYVNLNDPLASQIRIKATDGHGGSRNSFGATDSAMMANLDYWLQSIRVDSRPGSLAPASPPELEPLQPTQWTDSEQAIPDPPTTTISPLDEATAQQVPVERQTRRMPQVDNPFDPEIFNRRFHAQ
ncbi:hypothetical protein NHH03_16780 [Stieleria sp. TO1_6]|uniref:hypothetical protein n=1 Tax=Stieleria tagensis TaxID=2956795 RepID=UPI00209AB8B4|nr:hypothetical protein [Stieleria tagensis]MCO8123407.1 hypothetical protein [Stieleria tagensis]